METQESKKNIVLKLKSKKSLGECYKPEKVKVKRNFLNFNRKFFKNIEENIKTSQIKSKVHYSFAGKQESNVSFSFFYFTKFLIYHFLYFFFLGPLSLLILVPIEGYALVYNMDFIGLTFGHLSTLMQFMGGLPNLFLSYKFCYLNEDSKKSFQFIECIFCTCFLIVRIIIISIRYGFSSEFQMNRRKNIKMSYDEKKKEFVIISWNNIENDVLDNEIDESMLRLEIDSDIFTYNIISNLTSEWIYRLSTIEYFGNKGINLEAERQKYFDLKNMDEQKRKVQILQKSIHKILQVPGDNNRSKKSQVSIMKIIPKKTNLDDENEIPIYAQKAPKELSLMNFPGRIFFKELFVYSNIQNLGLFFRAVITILVGLLIILPFFFRAFWLKEGKPFGGSLLEVYLILSNCIIGGVLMIFNVLILQINYLDYIRRTYILQSLEVLLNPDKQSIDNESLRYIPCLNIFLSRNFMTWMYYRLMAMDVGYKFMIKNQIYGSVLFFYNGVLILILILGGIGTIHLPICDNKLIYLMGLMQVIIIIIYISRIIWNGSLINNTLNNHVNELIGIKNNLFFIINNVTLIKSIDNPVNVMIRRAKEFLTVDENGFNIYGFREEELCDVISNTIKSINSVIERTENENLFRSLKILGLKLEFSLLYQIDILVITGLFTIIPLIYKTYNEQCYIKEL